MCGRFVSSSPPDEIARYFDAEPTAEAAVDPNWNVAPTTDVHVVLADEGVRRLTTHHWGLVPFWAKSPAIGNKLINARGEELAQKNAFKAAAKRRRCIVPADGFYEWEKVPGSKKKRPWYICRVDDEPLAFAGLWEKWREPRPQDDSQGSGEEQDRTPLRSATIITTEANELLARIHHRMPVILPPSAWDEWLDPDNDDLESLGRLLVPAPEEILQMHPVSTDVNNVRNGGPQLVDPVTEESAAG